MAQQFGAPDIDQRPSYALWRDESLLGPQLEIRCLGDGLYRLQMANPSLAKAHREQLERELETAVIEARQVIRGEPSAPPPAGGPPPQLGGKPGTF